MVHRLKANLLKVADCGYQYWCLIAVSSETIDDIDNRAIVVMSRHGHAYNVCSRLIYINDASVGVL